MKKIIILSLLIAFSCFISNGIYAQIKIKGTVNDKGTKETLIGTNVVIKGTTIGVTTDLDGKFELEVDSLPVTLQITYVGYGRQEIRVTDATTPLNISMRLTAFAGQEVVISASRVSETIMESPISIQKLSSKQILEAASGDFYQDLGNLQGVDVTTASMGFKVVNTRGFNTTFNTRLPQFIDGIDNQAPGLQLPIGNLIGASEIDLESVELISGPASALYGPNAMQGVLTMTTKNPFDYPGLTVMVKGGTRDYIDGQFRYARVLEFKGMDENAGSFKRALHKKLAFKLTGSYMEAQDWEATDTVANKYGDEFLGRDDPIEVNLSQKLREKKTDLEIKQKDETITQEEQDDLDDLTALIDGYFDLVSPKAWPGKIEIPPAPGYMESALADYSTRSTKFGAGLYYKLQDSLMISYDYKYGNGTAILQGTNRFSINNIRFHQHKLEMIGKNFFLRGYTTLEDAGGAYDLVFTGIFLSKKSIEDLYVPDYLSEYISIIDTLTNGFDDEADVWMIDSAHASALRAAENSWYQPGTPQFDSVFNAIINNPTRNKSGSKFVDASSLQHIEGQYDFTKMVNNKLKLGLASIIIGGSYRRYDPNSYGTIFSDTLVNNADALESGDIDIKDDYVDFSTWEYGAYTQISKRFIENKLKLSGSIRYDDHVNYDPQLSPRVSAVYTYKNHNFRFAVQSAFRSPTLQNQYLYIDLGSLFLTGNLNGSVDYTRSSVDEYNDLFDISKVSQQEYLNNLQNIDQLSKTVLKTITLDPVQPEHLKSLEVGYRGIIRNGLYVDLNAYYSSYTDFIANRRVIRPDGGAVAGEESGSDAIITKQYRLFQIPVNVKDEVITYGSSIGLAYYFGKGFMAKVNYTYAFMDTSNLTDLVPGFNTPKHKFNIGLQGTRIYKELGFSINYKWVDKFSWESSFGDGDVPSYSLVDVQLNYKFPDYHSTLRIGASNLLRNQHIEAYGSPTVGRMIYASWMFHLDDI